MIPASSDKTIPNFNYVNRKREHLSKCVTDSMKWSITEAAHWQNDAPCVLLPCCSRIILP